MRRILQAFVLASFSFSLLCGIATAAEEVTRDIAAGKEKTETGPLSHGFPSPFRPENCGAEQTDDCVHRAQIGAREVEHHDGHPGCEKAG